MRKLWKRVMLCALLSAAVWTAALISDRETLNDELIRLHVVANSDSQQDQDIKLQVRDAVLESIQGDLQNVADVSEAKAYLQENLPRIQAAAQQTLDALGVDAKAAVSLCREAFDTREYDTFSLPAGVYEALRVTIGEGAGKNWWCVAFPNLCMGAAAASFQDTAVGAGFSQPLADTLTEDAYEIRFFLLDAMGKVEAYLFDA